MDILHYLGMGFSISLSWSNLLYCFLGVTTGTLVGILPGLGPAATICMFLPVTYYLNPTTAIIVLAGIYYGAMYGGSTTSILLDIPGEAASVVTCLDGHQMALQGRAGPALGISAFGSFIAGTLGIVGLMVGAPLFARFALRFGPPEYFSLIFLAFSLIIHLASGSMLKAFIMIVAGVFAATIGTDSVTGYPRFVYGSLTLADGLGIVPVIMGLFGIADILENMERNLGKANIPKTKFKGFFPTLDDWKKSLAPIFRGTLIGFFLGLLPGGGTVVSSLASYAVEKKVSKHPEKFGKGAIEGVAGPESANNSAAIGNFIPLLTFGLPTTAVMAVILGALLMHGVTPGPALVLEQPGLFWGIVTSMYIGNGMLLVLNLPMIPIWVRVLSIPYRLLFPLILLFCVIGVYSLNGNIWEIIIMLIFGILGYLLRKLKYESVPFVFAFVLEPIIERAFRRSLLMSEGSFSIFFTRPISGTLMIAGFLLLFIPMLPLFKRKQLIK